jgi:histidinol phosphatase-like enzyme
MNDLPKAIIVDIDGTLAKMNGRGPFEWMRVNEDRINGPIRKVVHLFWADGYTIIIFSGRDGVCKQLTEKWLDDHLVPFNHLFMRPEGNFEKDAIIKRRMYDGHVKDKFDVEFVLDDRNQVVDMWRKDLGLTCLQVDYGDF